MPELPEVEIVMRGLEKAMAGHRIARVELRRKDLRFPFPQGFAERLTGRRVEAFRRRAKYILADLEGGDCLLIHLGMSGRFAIVNGARIRNLGEFYFEEGAAAEAQGAHDHVVFTLDDGTRIIYTDPRRFGMMDVFPQDETADHRLLGGIGVEPLGNDFNAAHLAKAFAGKKAPLKAALLDQRLIAGLGNIYVCEALYRAKLSPRRKAGTMVKRGKPDPRLEDLARHIKAVLGEAIIAGGSTLRDFAQTDGTNGGFQERFSVYDREGEPCPRCGKPIRRIVQAGRSTFYCPSCQK
ncbi:MAG: bifunctional DNA-formamidopyrimidine glycosylase/DNA-(apurinic or apyrimidinic site) lyase [Hyphomicrobiales bacterium]